MFHSMNLSRGEVSEMRSVSAGIGEHDVEHQLHHMSPRLTTDVALPRTKDIIIITTEAAGCIDVVPSSIM